MYFRLLVIVAICVQIGSGEKQKHEFKHKLGHLKEIPKRFEVQDINAEEIFTRYLRDIRDLARLANMTVRYKVKVELQKPTNKKIKKIEKGYKVKTKKYIVPLKRKNMKLSNFEIIMRKQVDQMASEASVAMQQVPKSTEEPPHFITTKAMFNGKYKPILRHVKSNYTKIVKPVRNKIITLNYEPVVQ
ncbi:PREDICTED: uncharacterized protein LOC106115210 [Papilio xuthus]|uniref:Uncharacterized protein LOC106115210 n=2 Tax=Papilio xuthus TaxID=66420 RepID=A0AAJ6Z2F8_PAPXU|nr:PREDICTED: uncharacterized protein LOC106115210 [Papilio xuthus]